MTQEQLNLEPHTFETLRESVLSAVNYQIDNGHTRILVDQACGTGKTKTELDLTKLLKAKVTVIFVPTITLAHQNSRYVDNQDVLFICSDKSVTDNPEYLVTTDIRDIYDAILEAKNSDNNLIIFCTYTSSDKFVELYKVYPGAPEIPLALYDEAHYASQINSGLFSCTLDDTAVRFKRRVFFTASPKISMLEEEFGVLAHEYSTAQAIADGLIKDYYMVIAMVSNKEVAGMITDNEIARNAGLAIAAGKAILECNLSSLISFHTTVISAKKMATAWNLIKEKLGLSHIEADWVDGSMSSGQIKSKLNRLTEGNYILCSCQVIGVGVDVPQVNGLIFSDPRQAHISVQQAVGRGQRKLSSADNEPLPVILPTIVDDEDNYAKFRELIRFLQRLRLGEEGAAPNRVGKAYVSQVLNKDGGSISLVGINELIDQKFIDAIQLEIKGTASRQSLEHFSERCKKYDDYVITHWRHPEGHSMIKGGNDGREEEMSLYFWASRLRLSHAHNMLSAFKKNLVDKICPNFIWGNPKTQNFEKHLSLLNRYISIHKSYPPKDHKITMWLRHNSSPSSMANKFLISQEQYDYLTKMHPDYVSKFRNRSYGLDDHFMNVFIEKMVEVKKVFDETQHLPGFDNKNLWGFAREVKRRLLMSKNQLRINWLKNNFIEFFVATHKKTHTKGRYKKSSFSEDYLKLARFVLDNNRVPTTEEMDIFRIYKLMLNSYNNETLPIDLNFFVELFLKGNQ